MKNTLKYKKIHNRRKISNVWADDINLNKVSISISKSVKSNNKKGLWLFVLKKLEI